MADTKLCPKCGRTLPVTEFYKNSSKGDGVSTYCKECTKTAISSYKKKKRTGDLVAKLIECSEKKAQEEIKQQKQEEKTSTALKYASVQQLKEEILSRGNEVLVNPQPRDLISLLCKKGYRGKLEYTVIQTIDVGNFNTIHNG